MVTSLAFPTVYGSKTPWQVRGSRFSALEPCHEPTPCRQAIFLTHADRYMGPAIRTRFEAEGARVQVGTERPRSAEAEEASSIMWKASMCWWPTWLSRPSRCGRRH